MSSTHSSLFYHFVFSTKDRRPLIPTEEIDRVHRYLGGSIRNMGGIAHSIGGIEDHVHLFLTLGPNHTLSMVMKQLKGESSKWAKAELGLRNFAWQEGYGVFTVSASNYAGVNRYVLNQERRHRKTTFQDEYVAMLKKGLVEYDERYLW